MCFISMCSVLNTLLRIYNFYISQTSLYTLFFFYPSSECIFVLLVFGQKLRSLMISLFVFWNLWKFIRVTMKKEYWNLFFKLLFQTITQKLRSVLYLQIALSFSIKESSDPYFWKGGIEIRHSLYSAKVVGSYDGNERKI